MIAPILARRRRCVTVVLVGSASLRRVSAERRPKNYGLQALPPRERGRGSRTTTARISFLTAIPNASDTYFVPCDSAAAVSSDSQRAAGESRLLRLPSRRAPAARRCRRVGLSRLRAPLASGL